MTRTDVDARLRSITRFALSPSFEFFFALAALTDRESTLHSGWQKEAGMVLAGSFWSRFERLGGWPLLWIVVPDAFPEIPPEGSVDQALDRLAEQPIEEFRSLLLTGILHFEDQAQRLIDKKASLPEVMAAVPRSKLEWYLFIGLYPYDAKSPAARTIELLLGDPQGFRAEMLKLAREFWRKSFSKTWESMRSGLEASLEQKQRLFESCTVARFFDLLHLRVEIDPRHENIIPIRGDAKLPIAEVGECLIFPSAFNDKRFWHARVVNDRIQAAFPYFDSTIGLRSQATRVDADGQPELDPALIFRALGNTTRFGIAILLARSPQTSVELARALSLSRPTISHHIHKLREAGLLKERPHKASILLELNRDTLEHLSDISIRALYPQGKSHDGYDAAEHRTTLLR